MIFQLFVCVCVNVNEVKSLKFEFQTASQSEIAFKSAKKSKYGNFNFCFFQHTLVYIENYDQFLGLNQFNRDFFSV